MVGESCPVQYVFCHASETVWPHEELLEPFYCPVCHSSSNEEIFADASFILSDELKAPAKSCMAGTECDALTTAVSFFPVPSHFKTCFTILILFSCSMSAVLLQPSLPLGLTHARSSFTTTLCLGERTYSAFVKQFIIWKEYFDRYECRPTHNGISFFQANYQPVY